MWRVAGAAAVAGLALALVFAPEREVVTSIAIAGSPAQVWAVLVDTADYPRWNPDMRVVGRLAAGEVIEHRVGRGADAMVFHPVVLEAVPGVALRWFGRVWFWHVFDAEHYFTMAPQAGGTVFTQGERARGVGLWLFDVRQLAAGFNAMDLALKQRVERK